MKCEVYDVKSSGNVTYAGFLWNARLVIFAMLYNMGKNLSLHSSASVGQQRD